MIRSDRGSETVQFAVAAPLLLLVVFSTMQVGGMMLAATQLSSDIVWACRQLDVAGLRHAADKEAFVKAGILGSATQLDPENLSVDRVLSRSEEVEAAGFSASGEPVDRRSKVTALSYEVRYDVPSILDVPGLSGRSFARQVDCRYVEGCAVEIQLGRAS
ncbi:MAG: hypothetical protein PEGG_00951 [Paraeggerthella hongkongensis]